MLPKNNIDITSTQYFRPTSLSIESLFYGLQALKNPPPLFKQLGLDLHYFEFSSPESDNKDRRPQGVTKKGDYIINSWYFTNDATSTNKDKCKLTIADTNTNAYVNVVPVERNSAGKYEGITSHAGGITIVGDYLYMVDKIGSDKGMRVFSLNNILEVNKNTQDIATDASSFILDYSYMLPEVGVFTVDTPSNVNLSYLSVAMIDNTSYFLTGNFYKSDESKYNAGGKSMMWLFPINTNGPSFPFIDTTAKTYQIEPMYPSGEHKNKTVSRIQGATITDNVLMISRSWADKSYQLIGIEYSRDIRKLDDYKTDKISEYFDGTDTSPENNNAKNWLVGCENLHHDRETGNLYTVTEFKPDYRSSPGRRNYYVDYDSVKALINQPPS